MRRYRLATLPRLLVVGLVGVSLSLIPASASGDPDKLSRLQSTPFTTTQRASHLQLQLDALREKLKRRARPITLKDAVEQSLLTNPGLAESYRQIQQQQWNLIAVRRQWYPQITGSSLGINLFGYRSTTSNTLNSNSPGFTPRTSFTNLVETSPSLQLSWTFFKPSRGALINAASEELRAQQLLFDVSARDLVLETQLAYFALQEQKQLASDYEAILNSTSRQVERTEALFSAGAASVGDVEQIRTQQLQNLSKLIDTYRLLVDAAARLAAAMALPTGVLVMPQDRLSLLMPWTQSETETLHYAERMREEIQASLAKASSSGWNAMSYLYSYWPNFSTNASGSLLNTNSAFGNPGSEVTLNNQLSTWTGAVGLGFSWLIFDGGINAAQAEQRKAQAKMFNDQAAVIRLSVAREVERAYANYQASTLALESTKLQLESAETAARVVRERFNIGFADMTSVVQTYNQSIQAASSYAQSLREYNTSVASLYRYSASWPDGALSLLQSRVKQIK